ncbi:hypothetical protein SAMN04487852_103217 [Prevotella sp. tf2-5]|nr:hypothetical protein SAMN04487852_103217 [Prevotella sp. tf2-5]
MKDYRNDYQETHRCDKYYVTLQDGSIYRHESKKY